LNASVVIRVCTSKDEIFRLLSALAGQTMKPVQVVLIDSGSAGWVVDGERKIQTSGLSCPDGSTIPVEFLQIDKSTYQSARSLNQAIAHATGELVAIISQDALPADNHYLESLITAFRDPRVAGAYGRQILGDQYCPFGEKDLNKTYPPVSRIQTAPDCWFVNTCSMIRRELWKDHPFDELANISEDHEWAKWAQGRGYLIRYEAGAVVKHYHIDTLEKLWQRHYEEGRGLYYVHGRHWPLTTTVYGFARETASDMVWLLRKGKPWYAPQSLARRFVKHAALYRGSRNAGNGSH
jgi:rhamnosyltransferase